MIYLGLALVLVIIGVAAVALHHHQPKGMGSSIAEFERGRQALAPEPDRPDAPRRRSRPGRG